MGNNKNFTMVDDAKDANAHGVPPESSPDLES